MPDLSEVVQNCFTLPFDPSVPPPQLSSNSNSNVDTHSLSSPVLSNVNLHGTNDAVSTESNNPMVYQVNYDDEEDEEKTTLDQLKLDLDRAKELQMLERQAIRDKEKEDARIDGLGKVLDRLRGVMDPADSTEANEKRRIVLDGKGSVVSGRKLASVQKSGGGIVIRRVSDLDLDLPPLPPHPTDPADIRKLVRTKMVRCKKCGNRFGEQNLLERHLRDKHPVDYCKYLYQEELETQAQREEELERNRIEELTSGGFIPTQADIDAAQFNVQPGAIPLPGEGTNGVAARFRPDGSLIQPKRQYKKKVSPQCVFCDKRFRNEVSLKKHIGKKHPESVEFVQCLDCFKCLSSAQLLPAHQCDLTWLCFECTPIRNMCSEERLRKHRIKFHRGANSGFRCNECNLKFLTPRKLRKHKKMSHVYVKTYQCHFCEELFTAETAVMTHERIHTGILKFECKICDFKCNRYQHMEDHKREEHGYLCTICQGKFADWADMKNHTLKEHGGYLTSESNTGIIHCIHYGGGVADLRYSDAHRHRVK